jgi:hypothetical protein
MQTKETLEQLSARLHKEWMDFFEEAFTNPTTRQPYDVPPDIKKAAIDIAGAYNAKGICDPMYIANTIAHNVGRGDGKSHFAPIDRCSVNMGFCRWSRADINQLFPGWEIHSERREGELDGEQVFDLVRK